MAPFYEGIRVAAAQRFVTQVTDATTFLPYRSPVVRPTQEITMHANVSGVERTLRIVVGLAILGLLPLVDSPIRWLAPIGFVPLVTGLVGWCPAYRLFGRRTPKAG
jgi:hypothetical protein